MIRYNLRELTALLEIKGYKYTPVSDPEEDVTDLLVQVLGTSAGARSYWLLFLVEKEEIPELIATLEDIEELEILRWRLRIGK